MKIKEGREQVWNEYKEKNTDLYGAGIVSYAEDWANLMEREMAKQPSTNIEDVIVKYAEPTSREADTDGITGFMYGASVKVLSDVWEYGEILRKWHNKEYNYNGGGVVNPAIITIG
jgi:hypothetical protein